MCFFFLLSERKFSILRPFQSCRLATTLISNFTLKSCNITPSPEACSPYASPLPFALLILYILQSVKISLISKWDNNFTTPYEVIKHLTAYKSGSLGRYMLCVLFCCNQSFLSDLGENCSEKNTKTLIRVRNRKWPQKNIQAHCYYCVHM